MLDFAQIEEQQAQCVRALAGVMHALMTVTRALVAMMHALASSSSCDACSGIFK
jgi:hypothetical protein